MRRKSIGEVLRAAREVRDLTLVDVQRMTKIQAKYLQALEYNDFDFVVDSCDIASILTIYAEALDLDADVLLEAYETNSLVKYHEDGEEEIRSSELRRTYRERKRKKKSYLPLIYLLLAASLIIIFVTYIVYSRLQNQTNPTLQTTSYSVVGQAISKTSTDSEKSVAESPSSSSAVSSGSSTGNIVISGSGAHIVATIANVTYPLEIVVTAKNTTSWISLSGTSLAEGVVLSPDKPTVTTRIEKGVASADLVLGVVKGIEVTIGGQKIDMSALTSDTGTITLNFKQG